MKVILIEDLDNLGQAGEIVDVKDGYARNYLLPKGLVIEATEENLANWQEEKDKREAEERQRKENAEEVKAKLEEITIELEAKAGEDGRLFGSITNMDIADVLAEEYNVNIEKRKIELDENIKQEGLTIVPVRLYPEVVADLKVQVNPRD